MKRLTRDGTVENIMFPVLQLSTTRMDKPYPVDPFPCYIWGRGGGDLTETVSFRFDTQLIEVWDLTLS